MPSNITVYDEEIKIKYSNLNHGSLRQCYLVNKDSLVESILKENIKNCVILTGYLFCCNDVRISFIVQRNTQSNRYFMMSCENEQFHLLGPFSLKVDFQSVLRTLESLFWFLVLLHVKYHKM